MTKEPEDTYHKFNFGTTWWVIDPGSEELANYKRVKGFIKRYGKERLAQDKTVQKVAGKYGVKFTTVREELDKIRKTMQETYNRF